MVVKMYSSNFESKTPDASSTIPGYVANRDTVRGSWFIECICKVFMSYAATTDIRDMLDKVSMEMSSYVSETGTKQTCSYEVRHFYKKLFLVKFTGISRVYNNIGIKVDYLFQFFD